MLATIGENNERRLQVFGVAPGLLFCVIRIQVFALSFKHAEHAGKFIFQKVIDPAGRSVELKLNLLWIKQIPATEFQGSIYKNARKCFVLALGHII
jgi:hypothetical protein